MLISGPVLKWVSGTQISEYSFTEKPTIEKTSAVDYDRWAYSGLDIELPDIGDLNRTEFNDVVTSLTVRQSPYLNEELEFTAGLTSGNTGVGHGAGSWSTGSTTAKRTLRYSSDTSDGSIDKPYNGVLSQVYYNANEMALVVIYTSPIATLEDGYDHPQGIIINGLTYIYESIIESSGTLTCYVFLSESPFTSGDKYKVEQPYSDVLRQSTTLNRDVQIANEDNQNTNIKLNDIRLRRLQKVESTTVSVDPGLAHVSTIDMIQLNGLNHVGAFITTFSQTNQTQVGVTSPQTTAIRAKKDITIASSLGFDFGEAIVAVGNTMWVFQNSSPRKGLAYNITTGRRDTSKDFNNISAQFISGAV